MHQIKHNETQIIKHIRVWYLAGSVLNDLCFIVFYLLHFVVYYIEEKTHFYMKRICRPTLLELIMLS